MARIFISYKRANKEQVFPIVDYIEQQLGVKCWVDLDGIESSAQFASVICNAIDATDVVLFMHSLVHLNIDFENDWTIKEHNYAVAKKKRIILVKLDDAPLDNIFLMEYGSKNNIDSRIDAQMQKLLKDLRVWLKLPESYVKKGIGNSPKSYQKESPNEIIINVKKVSFKMIKVEGGTFLMGAQSKDKTQPNYDPEAYENESPVHRVTLRDYYIGETLVTQELWETVMGSNPLHLRDVGVRKPVHNMLWEDIQTFIKKLNKLTDRIFRLPTEAEWEYAARGGIKSKGYKYSGSNNLDDVAWYNDNNNYEIQDVGTKAPNELGIYDMSGNVAEWCGDWYMSDYYSESPYIDPIGPKEGYRGKDRVFRGGDDWYDRDCRVSNRSGIAPEHYYPYGFRMVLFI